MNDAMSKKIVQKEFHISLAARQKYQFDETLYSSSGNVIFANYHAARVFAHQINQKRNVSVHPEQAVKAGDLYAMGLIDEILHYIVLLYRQQIKSSVITEALAVCVSDLGSASVDSLLYRFVTEFPASDIIQKKNTPESYLSDRDHSQVILEEILMLWLANMNPAFRPFTELFDDATLNKTTSYPKAIQKLISYFEKQPPFGPDRQTLIELLRAPAKASPYSLQGQLEFIRSRWGVLIQDRYLQKLLTSLDFIKEEAKFGGQGPGAILAPDFKSELEAPERFSADLHWMPKVVMLAKNAHVWLDQLSKQTGRHITRLDQVPDETLDTLARWGFTALWLIGVWERSTASKRIKQMCGNPEAEASAYALHDYQIAADMGGEEAFDNLKRRAWQRGIRMAGDMVPNHVGIDSRWVIQHPDWFISLPYSPFPSYNFNGQDLSLDERVGIYIEDHYYNRTDAAVVFKRRDHWTGDERYIYHGNDGTSMPWNDTAQLNFLNPEVREAVIQTILHVARQFPIIRFDAAMTLTQKHFQRLWFPEPGHGGDIASRAEHGLTKAQFFEAMPNEFWREVVDRVAEEAPDTLLLAEAFWLLEGYFVRTLGMHRVYNSAFMNMLKNEDNAGYRDLIRKTLEFNPEILKRFVNFMNNPDEQTAVAQFGKDDKYFGVCLLMATMPGLPMFGHGQIEGFTEKYGMEYRRAYWDESPDTWLIQRHEREIFPLLRKRALFAEVTSYCLYDVVTPEGNVNENVFAQSNFSGEARALYVYHNTWADTRGWIRNSVVTGKSLGEGLGLDQRPFTIFREHISGLEYIRSTRDLFEAGLYVELGAFKYQLFWNFWQVSDETDEYRQIHDALNGCGVPDINEAIREMRLKPVLEPFRILIHPEFIQTLMNAMIDYKTMPDPVILDLSNRLMNFYHSFQIHINTMQDIQNIVSKTVSLVKAYIQPPPKTRTLRLFAAEIRPRTSADLCAVLGWIFLSPLTRFSEDAGGFSQSQIWMDEFLLGRAFGQMCQNLGFDEHLQWEVLALIKVMLGKPVMINAQESAAEQAKTLCGWLFEDYSAQQYLQVNRFEGILYFNKERFDALIRMIFTAHFIRSQSSILKIYKISIKQLSETYSEIQQAEAASGFQVEKMLRLLDTG